MKVKIISKDINDSFLQFEMKISKLDYDKRKDGYTIVDINILHDGKNLIAVIKYI